MGAGFQKEKTPKSVYTHIHTQWSPFHIVTCHSHSEVKDSLVRGPQALGGSPQVRKCDSPCRKAWEGTGRCHLHHLSTVTSLSGDSAPTWKEQRERAASPSLPSSAQLLRYECQGAPTLPSPRPKTDTCDVCIHCIKIKFE